MNENKITNYITSNLKYIRKKLNLSQNKFAELLNVNQTTVARWEDENRKPSIDKSIEISVILNISLDALTGIDFNMVNYDITNIPLTKFDNVKDE